MLFLAELALLSLDTLGSFFFFLQPAVSFSQQFSLLVMKAWSSPLKINGMENVPFPYPDTPVPHNHVRYSVRSWLDAIKLCLQMG